MVETLPGDFHTGTDFSAARASMPVCLLSPGSAMKRWLVVLLVLLALLVMLAPGIVGRLAERNIEASIDWAERDTPGVNIETESYDRGWFSSEGRYRIVFDEGRFSAVADDYRSATGNDQLPSLIVDTKLAHGPLPGGSLTPGLASTVSTFSIDPGDGDQIPIKGELRSHVSLDGSTQSRLLLEPDSFTRDDATLEWQGADLAIDSDTASGMVRVDGEIHPWQVSADDANAEVGAITVKAEQVRGDYDLRLGSADVRIGQIRLDDEGAVFTMSGMSITTDTSLDGDRLDTRADVTIDDMTAPPVGVIDFTLSFALEDADAASAARIGEALKDADAAGDPNAAIGSVYSEIEDDVQTLFRRGFGLRLDKLDVTLPQGVVATTLTIDVAESDADAPFSWSTVLLKTTGTLNLRIPAAVYEMAAMMDAQAGALVAMGLLVPDGDDYVMKAEYAQGLFNVNGAPMPIPMPQ